MTLQTVLPVPSSTYSGSVNTAIVGAKLLESSKILMPAKKKQLPLVGRRSKIPFGGSRVMMWLEETAWVWGPTVVGLGILLTCEVVRLGAQVRDLQRRMNRIDPRRRATVRHLRRVA